MSFKKSNKGFPHFSVPALLLTVHSKGTLKTVKYPTKTVKYLTSTYFDFIQNRNRNLLFAYFSTSSLEFDE